ncbi:MAG: TIGR02530 family flagellar biosynthesis protein [Bdellovibrionales bacterium]|nr:TIGR02530 family flagellar biosynthesis protein [Bdellovibrionales bacterium]
MSQFAVAKNIGSGASAVGGISSAREGIESTRNREKIGSDFKNTLRDTITSAGSPTVTGAAAEQAAKNVDNLRFSAHAVDRMKSRGISFAPDMMKNIESAVARAASKGSRDTLVLAGDNALIVSVKNNTVVTVMDRAAMRENVFTNIDSTVVV